MLKQLQTILLLLTCVAVGPSNIAHGQTDTVTLPTKSFYVDNKTYTDPNPISLTMSSPADQGMSKTTLDAGAKTLGANKAARSLIVSRNGFVVGEYYFNGAKVNEARNIHSASKTVESALAGELIREGVITLGSTPKQVFGSKFTYKDKATGDTPLSVWLTMTSGLSYEEDSTEYGFKNNFTQAIFNLKRSSSAGSKGNYSTADAYIVGAMLQEASGKPMPQLLSENFGGFMYPVKIGKSPEGYHFCCCNFFQTPRRMMAFGQVLLDASHGQAESMLEKSWWDQMATKRSALYSSSKNYGFLLWLDVSLNKHVGARAWGWGKQFIYVFPTDNLVCVITHDTNGSVSDSDLNSFVQKSVIGALTN